MRNFDFKKKLLRASLLVDEDYIVNNYAIQPASCHLIVFNKPIYLSIYLSIYLPIYLQTGIKLTISFIDSVGAARTYHSWRA